MSPFLQRPRRLLRCMTRIEILPTLRDSSRSTWTANCQLPLVCPNARPSWKVHQERPPRETVPWNHKSQLTANYTAYRPVRRGATGRRDHPSLQLRPAPVTRSLLCNPPMKTPTQIRHLALIYSDLLSVAPTRTSLSSATIRTKIRRLPRHHNCSLDLKQRAHHSNMSRA